MVIIVDENEQNQNAGDPSGGNSVITADPGNAGVDPSVNSGDPDGNVSPQTANQGNEELSKMKAEIKRLNRAIVEAKRGNRTQGQGADYNEEILSTPEGQYAVSLEVADARLRVGLEDRLKLYPEISEEDKARIRSNPWAFANRQSWMTGNYEQALDEIELTLLDRVEDTSSQQPNQNLQGDSQAQPANIQGNPAPEIVNPGMADAGGEEDVNPWTMPIDKLERLAEEQFKKAQAQ
ncbi:MAG: hypothetical protein IPM48_14865 [Saprospiraceae bacterium]|nr:hypothetical protein [Saprospiraceae bacterium]